MNFAQLGRCLVLMLSAAAGGSAFAQTSPPLEDHATISSPTAVNGVATVNVAVGSQNQQLNAGVFAGGSLSSAGADINQAFSEWGLGDRPASVGVGAGSFAGSSGWIAVNGVAGANNQQANVAVIAFGIEGQGLTDIALSQTRSSQQPAGRPDGSVADPQHSVAIGQGAFGGSSGLVQVSLVGGDRNSSANTFALSMSGGGKAN